MSQETAPDRYPRDVGEGEEQARSPGRWACCWLALAGAGKHSQEEIQWVGGSSPGYQKLDFPDVLYL